MTLAIRDARASEKPALDALQLKASLANEGDRAHIEANPGVIDLPPEQIEDGHVIVAERDGAIVGFAVVLPRADGEADLDGLFVDPAHWRQGIARRLVEAAARLARKRGARALHVIGNEHARAFYERQGFQPVGEAQTQFGPAPTFRKPLTSAQRKA